MEELRCSIQKQSGGLISTNGSYSEIENFILENMGDIKNCRTIERGNPTKFIEDLCMKNC